MTRPYMLPNRNYSKRKNTSRLAGLVVYKEICELTKSFESLFIYNCEILKTLNKRFFFFFENPVDPTLQSNAVFLELLLTLF